MIFQTAYRKAVSMTQGRIRKGVESSIKAAVQSGNLDIGKHAAPIAMLRYMADAIDQGDGESTLKAVTPASFLSYCNALGLVPGSDFVDLKKPKPKLATLRASNGKFVKAKDA